MILWLYIFVDAAVATGKKNLCIFFFVWIDYCCNFIQMDYNRIKFKQVSAKKTYTKTHAQWKKKKFIQIIAPMAPQWTIVAANIHFNPKRLTYKIIRGTSQKYIPDWYWFSGCFRFFPSIYSVCFWIWRSSIIYWLQSNSWHTKKQSHNIFRFFLLLLMACP